MHYTQQFTSALEFLEANDQMPFNATITLLIAIGEEVKKTDKQLLQTNPSMEWQNIADMRNVLAHDYRGIDEDIVFKVVKVELPKLTSALIQLLQIFSKSEVAEVLTTKKYQHLKKMMFEHMLPALQRSDLLAFGAYMQDLQAYNGDYFAPAQGGRYASHDVAEVLAWLQANGASCVGQSSWGPTGFAILANQQQAENLQTQAQLAFADTPNISFTIVRGKNSGASISAIDVSEVNGSQDVILES